MKESFSKNGLPYTLVKRNKFAVMYGVGGTYTDRISHYEVCKIKKVKDKEILGQIIPAHETIPGNEEFGTEGKIVTVTGEPL